MEKKVRNGLIITGITLALGLSLWLYVSIKKKNDASWKLLNLPTGSKKGTKFKIIRNN
jgi:hypothetical protein